MEREKEREGRSGTAYIVRSQGKGYKHITLSIRM
jgi:hypothetical protein